MTTQQRALAQHVHAGAASGARAARLSALGTSAGARLIVAALLLAALWAGAYWALH
ncbi:hypothetical protein IYY11_06430 [Methylocystis sp. H62]|uniref:hypothetical protein n=1 Tax=Methylocystis sp. H62 TaxID=2785789 RepID=UPI0018C349BC|nr:hypothetical protein [Methylocystis sp. H62]MBG0793025.1 hypothetical protein [Methylocystis sp. H62]